MKTEMSSFDIAAMVKELQCLIGARMDKAYQLAREALLLRLKVPDAGKKDLIIVVGKWIYLTDKAPEAPKTPTSFAMLLRKHLSNGTITGVKQHEFDRIVEITIQKTEQYQLIFEMFREGNVVLVSGGKIIQPLIPKSWKQREVRAKRDYVFPPSRNDFRNIERDELLNILHRSDKDLVRTLATDFNLGGLYAEETCLLADIEKNKKAAQLSLEEGDHVLGAVYSLCQSLSEFRQGFIVSRDSKPIDVIPFALKGYAGCEKAEFGTLSQAVEKYLESFREPEPVDTQYNEVKERLIRQKMQQEEAVANQEKTAERYKKIAELIYANYQECQGTLEAIKEGFASRNIPEVIQQLKEKGSFISMDSSRQEATILLLDEEGSRFEAVLNLRKSLEENAGGYYDSAKKAREKLKGAEDSLKETVRRLADLDGEHVARKKGKKTATKRFWFESYRWFISSDGNVVIAGRDAKSNDKVVKKYLTERDRYAHADIHGAPSVVIKYKDQEISSRTLTEACEFALAHSKAWNAKIASGSAYWVTPDQVSKTPPSGEFVPKGAFIIRGKRNYIQDIFLQMAVGEILYEGERKLMCASVSAIESQCQGYVIIEPGDTRKSDILRMLCDIFEVEQDEMERILPPGDMKVVGLVGLSKDVSNAR